MKGKRTIILLVAVVLVLSLGITTISAQGSDEKKQEVITWSLFTSFGPTDSGCCIIWPQLFEEIEERTDGRMKINIFWNGQHPYSGSDMLKIARDGIVEIAHISSGYLTSVEPILGFDSIPMLLPVDPMKKYEATAALWGNFKQDRSGILEKVLQDKWKSTAIHGMPASPITFFTKGYEVTGLNSLKGHKIRVYSPELAQLVQLMGGTPVSLSAGEVYTALSTGLIDGAITGLQFANANGWMDELDTINNWDLTAMVDGLIVGQEALNSLPEDIREIFLDVMSTSANKPEMYELEADQKVLDMLIASKGRKVFTPTPAKWNEVKVLVEKEIIAPWKNSIGKDADEAVKTIQNFF